MSERERLERKASEGALNIVSKILEQPEVQRAITRAVGKQAMISGLFMSFFLVGFFMLFDVAKEVLGHTWQGDLFLGLAMIAVGGAYMLKSVRK